MKTEGTIIQIKRRLIQAVSVLILSVICHLSTISYLNGAAGTSRAEFLRIGVGARASGMGGAFTAVADDVSTISYNPAGLGHIKDTQFTLMHSEWIDDIGYEYMGFAHSFGSAGTLGAEIRYLHMGDILGRALNGERTKNFSVSNLAATLSYGRELLKDVSFGVNVKILRENIEEESSTGVAFDIGELYSIQIADNRLQLGLTIQNLGPGMKFVNNKEPLPLNLKVGAAYKMLKNSLIMAVDVNIPKGGAPFLNFGSEYSFMNIASARIGYKTEKELETSARLSLGLGFNRKDYGLDYTFVPFNDLGRTHRISLSVRFGGGQIKNKIAALKINKVDNEMTLAENSKEKIAFIFKKINELKKEDIVIKLSDKFIYFDNVAINIEKEKYSVFERLADVLLIMTEFKIEIINSAGNIKTYFLDRGISAERII